MQGFLRILQWVLIVVGLVLVGFVVAALAHKEMGSRSAMREFEEAREAVLEARLGEEAPPSLEGAEEPPPRRLPESLPLDTSLWAPGRIAEYEKSLALEPGVPFAVLRVPKIGLEVPVLEGTDEVTLNRGVGRIEGTAGIETMGNLGLAGHRDGFFRGLKDVVVGDTLELETLTGTLEFVIDDISIVEPTEVSVLAPTAQPTITLVTCYPFYFVGHAPQRYIVRATLVDSDESEEAAGG